MAHETERMMYDIAIIGNFTRDTIESPSGTRMVDGGGFNYGAHVTAMMGLKTAAVTRLAKEDQRVVDALVRIGVDVFPTYTPHSTCLRLYYPTNDPDQRILTVTHTAGAFTPDQVDGIEARAYLLNGSMRGEIGIDLVRALRAKAGVLAADVQAFARTVGPDGTLRYKPWPEQQDFLPQFDILKTDSVEAEMLTGERDIRAAARALEACGPREIVLTHRDGVLVLAQGAFHEAAFCPRQLIGRSGRGDTCISAYVAMRLSAPPEQATTWAAAVTSAKLEAEGPLKLSRAEIEQRFGG